MWKQTKACGHDHEPYRVVSYVYETFFDIGPAIS